MKEMTIAARLENIEPVTAFVDAFLEEIDCPLKTQTRIAPHAPRTSSAPRAYRALYGNIRQGDP